MSWETHEDAGYGTYSSQWCSNAYQSVEANSLCDSLNFSHFTTNSSGFESEYSSLTQYETSSSCSRGPLLESPRLASVSFPEVCQSFQQHAQCSPNFRTGSQPLQNELLVPGKSFSSFFTSGRIDICSPYSSSSHTVSDTARRYSPYGSDNASRLSIANRKSRDWNRDYKPKWKCDRSRNRTFPNNLNSQLTSQTGLSRKNCSRSQNKFRTLMRDHKQTVNNRHHKSNELSQSAPPVEKSIANLLSSLFSKNLEDAGADKPSTAATASDTESAQLTVKMDSDVSPFGAVNNTPKEPECQNGHIGGRRKSKTSGKVITKARKQKILDSSKKSVLSRACRKFSATPGRSKNACKQAKITKQKDATNSVTKQKLKVNEEKESSVVDQSMVLKDIGQHASSNGCSSTKVRTVIKECNAQKDSASINDADVSAEKLVKNFSLKSMRKNEPSCKLAVHEEPAVPSKKKGFARKSSAVKVKAVETSEVFSMHETSGIEQSEANTFPDSTETTSSKTGENSSRKALNKTQVVPQNAQKSKKKSEAGRKQSKVLPKVKHIRINRSNASLLLRSMRNGIKPKNFYRGAANSHLSSRLKCRSPKKTSMSKEKLHALMKSKNKSSKSVVRNGKVRAHTSDVSIKKMSAVGEKKGLQKVTVSGNTAIANKQSLVIPQPAPQRAKKSVQSLPIARNDQQDSSAVDGEDANLRKVKKRRKYFKGGRYKLGLHGPPKKKKRKTVGVGESEGLVKSEGSTEESNDCEYHLENMTPANQSSSELIQSDVSQLDSEGKSIVTNGNCFKSLCTANSFSNSSAEEKMNVCDNLVEEKPVDTTLGSCETAATNCDSSQLSNLGESSSNNTDLQKLPRCTSPAVGFAKKSIIRNSLPHKPDVQHNAVQKTCSDDKVFTDDQKVLSDLNGLQRKALSCRALSRKSVLHNGIMKSLGQLGKMQKHICSCGMSLEDGVDSLFGDTSLVCQASDTVNSHRVNCRNIVKRRVLLRPSSNLPYKTMCERHIWLLRRHRCCPVCGDFCTKGAFLSCKMRRSKNCPPQLHIFHHKCLRKSACPHCGCSSSALIKPITLTEESTNSEDSSVDHSDTCTETLVVDSASDDSTTLKNGEIESSSMNICGPKRLFIVAEIQIVMNSSVLDLRLSSKHFYTQLKSGDVEKVVQLLVSGADPNYRFKAYKNNTALHVAAFHGFSYVAHVLIQAGACINSVNNNLMTPLMLAAEKKHVAVVKYLVIAGAAITLQDENGMTALHLAARSGDIKSMDAIIDSGKADINTQDDGGWTPLVWACEHKHFEAVACLLTNKADPCTADGERNIALHWAAYSGDADIANAILNAGCNIDSVNKNKDSPLHIAARKGHLDCAKLLISRGANPTVKNMDDMTAIMCCQDEESDIYKTLHKYVLLWQLPETPGRNKRVLLSDLARGRELHPIEVVSDINGDDFKTDFCYITKMCESPDININKIVKSMKSCRCRGSCSKATCNCSSMSLKLWYGQDHCLLSDFNMGHPPVIFECSKMCWCSQACVNRVIQHGTRCHLQLFRTISKGWGVRAVHDIKRGTFICQYMGELITSAEADKREDDSYIFDLDTGEGVNYCIDAKSYGNISRFLNHSCDPNLIAVKAFVDHHDLSSPHIAFFTNRDIKSHEELCFDYGRSFWLVKCRQILCCCKSPNCKYSKDNIDRTLNEYYEELQEQSSGNSVES